MKERLFEFLKRENKSSAQLAEEIGVQASGISNILSGRNNPSLDFILKMLEKYEFLSTDWLLFGKGTMYKDGKMQTLFDYEPGNLQENSELPNQHELNIRGIENQDAIKSKSANNSVNSANINTAGVVRIVWFYENNSFEEFYPRR
jgi:transcriptional regulator with XRE-family HTH domain